MQNNIDDLNEINAEAGIIATLVNNPEFVYYSEMLLPNHFTDQANRYIYTAICNIVRSGGTEIDPFLIIENLDSNIATQRYANELNPDSIKELLDLSNGIARSTIEEYQILVKKVMDAAFRRDAVIKLRECEDLCFDRRKENLEQEIYNKIDDIMEEFATTDDVPQLKDVVDECWEQIESRHSDGYAGIPFKFKHLNEYVTIEQGELVIFAAEQKQGKSMMLLNCAVDLLRKGKAVLYLDSELNTRLFTARMISHLTGIEYRRVTSGNYSEVERERIKEALAWIKTTNFTHIYIPMFDIQTIYTTVQKIKHTTGVDVLVIDYFKSSGDGDAFASYQELGKFVDTVKNKIAGDMGICAIGAAQATATGKVADSTKISRNASTILLLSDKTPEEIEADGVECGNKKLKVVFNRNGMQHATGEYLDFQFDGNKISYEEAPKQHIPQVPY